MKTSTQKSFAIISSILSLWLLILAGNARALVLYWDPNGTTSIGGAGTWDTTTKLFSGVSTQTASASLLVWPATGKLGGSNCAVCFSAGPSGSASQGTYTVTVDSALTIAGIFDGILNPGPGDVTLSGTGSLNLLTGLDAFDIYSPTLGFVRVNVPITGPGVITCESTGQLFLMASNSYTGGTALGYTGTSFSGIINYNNSHSFGTGGINITNTAGGICALVEDPSVTGVVVPNAWKITPAAGGINIVGDPSGAVFSGNWTLTSNLNIGSAVGTYDNSATVVISGVMSGAGAVNKFNPARLRLSGANTYTGSTTVSNGTLQLGANGGIPSGSGKGNVTLNNSGGVTNTLLDINGFSGSINGLSGNGTIDNTSASPGTLTFGNNNASSTFTGIFQSTGGQFNITKAGTGTFTWNSVNAGYSGNTTINGGKMLIATGGIIPYTSPVTIANSATLDLQGNGQTIGALSGGGTITNNAGGISLAGSTTPTNFAGYSCFFGAIDQGSLTKAGSGVMSLRQTNLYNINFSFQGGVLSVGAGPDRLPPTYTLNVPFGGLFQLDANNQTVAGLNGSGAVNLGGGTLTVNATSGSFYSGTIQNSELLTNSTAAGHGLRGYYYDNVDFSTLDTVRDDATINFANMTSLPGPPFPKTNMISVRWLGQVLTTVAGNYTFTGTSDDGQRLWVNGTNLIDDWVSQGATAKSGTISLAANTRYDIVMEYMNISVGGSVKLAWTPPGDTVSTVIPTDFLFLPGPGNLVVDGTSQVTLVSPSTYTGGTTVSSSGTLEASGDNTLGAGNVVVANGGILELDSGSANTYINSAADLVINSSSPTLTLNYSGTDTIHAFSVNGGTSYLATGTYGGIGSGAAHQISQIVGSGLLNVTATPASVLLTSSGGSSVYGSSVTFTSTVSGSGPTPTGTVTFYDGANALGLAALSGGVATLAVSDLQVPTSPHSVTVVYSGDANYIQATSSALSQTVTPLTISPGTLVVSNRVYDTTMNGVISTNSTLAGLLPGDTNNVHVTGGTATFSDKNVGTNKSVALSGLVLAGSLAGDYSLSPDSGSGTGNISVATLIITNITADDRVYNGTTNDTVTVGASPLVGVLGSDVVTLNAGTGNFTNANVGANKTVFATGFTLGGTDGTNYTAAQPTGLTASITQASTTNLLSSSANPSTPGASVSFTSTPTPIAPGGGTPTGSVIFVTNGVTFSTIPLSGGTAVSASTTDLSLGVNTIVAQYAGDANFIGSTNTLTQNVGSSPAPGALSISLVGGSVVLNWSNSFTLQSAAFITNGTNAQFSDVPGPVLTGPYTNTNGASSLFFRLRN